MAKLRLPMPHTGQRVVLGDGSRFKWFVGGRRWRKTSMDMTAAIAGHGPVGADGSPKWRGAVYGAHVIWAAPTFRQCGYGWAEMEKACGGSVKYDKAKMKVRFPGSGGMISFFSMDAPESSEGATGDGIIVDEAPLCSAQAWEQTLRPMISDTGGWAMLTGTPSGMNWYHRNFFGASGRRGHKSWQAPTLGVKVVEGELIRHPHPLENPEFEFEEAYDLWKSMPEKRFREQFLAEFVSDGGGVFRGVRAAIGDVEQAGALGDHAYVIGADWGKVNDFTVFTVVDANLGHVVALDRFNEIDTGLQIGRLQSLSARFGNCPVVGELNSIGMPIIEHAQSVGMDIIPFTTTNASKHLAIDALSLAFERGEIKIPDDEALVGELLAFECERMLNGMYRYSAPEGTHDDCVMSLAIAWSGVVNIPCFEFAELAL